MTKPDKYHYIWTRYFKNNVLLTDYICLTDYIYYLFNKKTFSYVNNPGYYSIKFFLKCKNWYVLKIINIFNDQGTRRRHVTL